jgi:tetratricopeptide (TPR) repeat protein
MNPDAARRVVAVVLLLGSITASSAAIGAEDPKPAPPSAAERESWHAEARRLLLSGDAVRAAEIYAELLARDASDERAAQGRVWALLAHDHCETALAEARAMHQRLSESTPIASVLGEAMFRMGLFEEVEPLLERLAELSDPPPRALITLARLRAAGNRRAQAEELVQRAVTAAPRDRNVQFWAAELAASRAQSIEYLERYLELAEGDDEDRVEAARGSLRLLRLLGDQQIWVPVTRPKRVELPLERVFARGAGLLGYAVKIRLGHKRTPVRVLLDTGSSGLFLVGRTARKRGFEPLVEETVFGGGGSQRHASERGLLAEFALGELRFANALATTTEQDLEPQGRFQGVLGIPIFDGYRVTLDLRRSKLILELGAALSQGSAYWAISGQMLVRVTANKERSGLFLFDTGATTTLLSADFALELEDARFDEPADVLGYGGLRQGARLVRGVNVAFEGLESGRGPLPAIDLSLRSRLVGVEISGYLGLNLLDRSTIVIDTQARRLEVTPQARR